MLRVLLSRASSTTFISQLLDIVILALERLLQLCILFFKHFYALLQCQNDISTMPNKYDTMNLLKFTKFTQLQTVLLRCGTILVVTAASQLQFSQQIQFAHLEVFIFLRHKSESLVQNCSVY